MPARPCLTGHGAVTAGISAVLNRLDAGQLVTPALVDAAAGAVAFFPKDGSTHKRLREAASTNDIACIHDGFASSSKRSRSH